MGRHFNLSMGTSLRGYIVLLVILSALVGSAEPAVQNLSEDAKRELYAARYKKAADLYSRARAENPNQPELVYGLVRALLRDHRSQDAYAAAADALERNPKAAAVQTAAGLAAYRRGELSEAEKFFRSALQLNTDDPGALRGLASLYSAVSAFHAARELDLKAYRAAPDDPELMLHYADTLKRAEHIAALEKVLPILDPDSEEAQKLRAHISDDRALGDRQTARLLSPYKANSIKLLRLQNGPSHTSGYGLRAQLNKRQTVTLLLDTGASGISLSPQAIKKAGLEKLGSETSPVKGIGDKAVYPSLSYLATELRIGEVAFADCSVDVFPTARSSDFDGIIGADVFSDFVITMDFPRLEVSLTPRPNHKPGDTREPVDAPAPPQGFHRIFRLGNHLAVPTMINGGKSSLFLIDSGAFENLIDTVVGKESTKVYGDDRTVVEGIQGKVKQASRAERVTLTFAGFQQENLNLLAISLDKLSDEMGIAIGGVLGLPVLAQLTVTVDYLEGTVRFEYRR